MAHDPACPLTGRRSLRLQHKSMWPSKSTEMRRDRTWISSSHGSPSTLVASSLNSDAHSVGDWPSAEIALAHARLAGVPTERVINCWPLERLVEWSRQRSSFLR